jgi:hypothetical protein
VRRWQQTTFKRWQFQKHKFLQEQQVRNKAIDDQRQAYLIGAEEGVLNFVEHLLSLSDYPDSFPQEFDFDFSAENKVLVVDYSLPNIDQLAAEIRLVEDDAGHRRTVMIVRGRGEGRPARRGGGLPSAASLQRLQLRGLEGRGPGL